MSARLRYLKLVSALLPAGVLGMSAALASAPAKASTFPTEPAPETARDGTAQRLQAIRDAVTAVGAEEGLIGKSSHPDIRLAWWLNSNGRGWGNGGRGWGNGGGPVWGNGGWHNWGNGGRFWRNF